MSTACRHSVQRHRVLPYAQLPFSPAPHPQTDELLGETRAAYGKGSGVEAVLARLKEALMSMPEHEVPMSVAKGFVEALGLTAEVSAAPHGCI